MENIGDAYIRVHARGDGIDDDIERQLDDADRVFTRKGREQGKAYGDSVQKGFNAKGRGKKMAQELVDLFSDDAERQGAKAGTTFFKGLEEALINAEGEDVGRRMFTRFREGFLQDTKGVVTVQINAEESEDQDALDRLIIRIQQTYPAAAKQAEDEVIRINRAAAKERERIQADLVRQVEDLEVALTRDLQRQQDFRENAVRLAAQRQARYWEQTWNEAIRVNERFNREMASGLRENERVFQRSRFTQVFTRDVDTLGETMARVFGKKSRSEFLNVLGRLAGGLTRLAFLPAKIGAGLFELGRSFVFAGSAAGGSLTGFARIGATFTQLGLTLPKLLGALIALPVAILGGVAVAGLLASGLSLLLGVVTALAATITFGLIGAVSSLVALMLPAAAAIGVLVAGIASMDEASKKMLKNAIAPMVKEFKTLGEVARKGLLSEIEPTIKNLTSAFKGLRPLVEAVGVAVAKVGLDFSRSLNSPGFRQFRDAMEKFLPLAIIQLGDITRQSLSGIGGIFRGMIPFMQRVLTYLDDVTQRFAEWANSAKGQTAIKQFFQDAGDSAKRLGGFLKEVGGLIKDLFTAGRGTGDSLFKSMEQAIARFRKHITSDPDILKSWFGSAQRFGEALGNLVVGAGKLMAALDSPVGRAAITGLINLTGRFLQLMGTGVGIINTILGGLGLRIADMLAAMGRAANALLPGNPGDKFIAMANGIRGAVQAGDDLAAGLKRLGDVAVNAGEKGKQGVSKISNAVNQTANSILLARAGITKYHDVLVNLPTRAVTMITTPGAVDSRNEVVALARQFNLTPKQVRTVMKLQGGKFTQKEIQEVIDYLKRADKTSSNPKIGTGKIKPAQTAALQAGKEVINTGKLKVNPKINVTSNAKDAATKAQKAMNAVNSITRSITVFLNKVGFASGGMMFNGIGFEKMASGGLMDEGPHKLALGGGMANFRQLYGNAIIGESGREAVVPLDRPLSLVDPTVRALAAFAQGKIGAQGPSVGVDASGWTILSNSEDPVTVARETLNQLTAASY